MMPVVRINDATFGDLKSIATWLGTRTPSETIDRIVREAMDRLDLEREDEPADASSKAVNGVSEFSTAPSLLFTKPLSAKINGRMMPKPNWSSILLQVMLLIKAKGLDGAALVRELHIPAKATKYEDEGFKYQASLGISVQGQSAADAWKEADRLAKKWRIPIIVEFIWRQTEKAQYPGQKGLIRSGGA